MKSNKKPKKKQEKTPPEESVLTREKFFKILDKVIRPVSEKEEPPEKEKKGTSE